MEKLKNYILSFMLMGSLLLAVGCTNFEETGNTYEGSEKESKPKIEEAEQNVRTVLENIFTGPNEEQEKVIHSNGDIEEFGEYLTDYQQENFKPYMSNDFYESHILKLNGGTRFLLAAYPKYMLEVDEITLEETESKEGDYDFNVKVTYTNKENEESETTNVEGTASTNEEGKITSIRYMNDEEFRNSLG